MRSMSDDWEEFLLAPAKLDAPASGWLEYPSPQEQPAGSYSSELLQSLFGVEPLEVYVCGELNPGARTSSAWLRSDADVIALRGKIAALEEEQDRLREQLRRLEGKLDEILATPGEMDTVPVDPHTRWIQENLEMLRNHPDEWIALHPVRGILFHTADGDEFAGMLDGLSTDERDDVLAFHSSMYI